MTHNMTLFLTHNMTLFLTHNMTLFLTHNMTLLLTHNMTLLLTHNMTLRKYISTHDKTCCFHHKCIEYNPKYSKVFLTSLQWVRLWKKPEGWGRQVAARSS